MKDPGRDYTVCTIVRVVRNKGVQIGPIYQVVDVFIDRGLRHYQTSAAVPSLFDQHLGYLRAWNVALVICDMTGIGQVKVVIPIPARRAQPRLQHEWAGGYAN